MGLIFEDIMTNLRLSDTVNTLCKVARDKSIRDEREITKDSYTWREFKQMEEGYLSDECDRSRESWSQTELKRLKSLNMTLLETPLLDAEEIETQVRYGNADFTRESPPMDALVGPVLPHCDVLYHLTSFYVNRYGKFLGRLDHLIRKNKTFGNPNTEAITFLKDKQTDELYGVWYPDTGCRSSGSGNHPIRFEIAVTELAKYRRIFHDSMGVGTQEADHNYIVFGGVPIQSIRAIEALDRKSGEVVKRVEI